jgi:hypothetical protein
VRLIANVERHTLLATRLRPWSGWCLPFVRMSLVLILCFINQPLVERLDECASVAVDVVALVLPEPHLLALGALSKYLLLH